MITNEEPPTKRLRHETTVAVGSSIINILNNNVNFSSCNSNELLQSLSKKYISEQPFSYGIIDDFFVQGFLENVRTELKQNSRVSFKESDLFRVYQSIDFGNLSEEEMGNEIPNLLQLKSLLYSYEFRQMMEKMTGLEPNTLTDEVDCAVNCHNQGCHLLCHDDVIGNRKLSFIIYVTDECWSSDDGGALELYENKVVDKKKLFVPEVNPMKKILPLFNRFVYFGVIPGVSFHSVQEVFNDRPRLSIQGWYHCKEPPIEVEKATLSQLKSDVDHTEVDFEQVRCNLNEENATLTKEDYTFLQEYLNPIYLEEGSLENIQTKFEEESSVQLCFFLNSIWQEKILKATCSQDTKDKLGKGQLPSDYSVGYSLKEENGWQVVGPPHKQRYLEYNNSSSKLGVGSLFMELKSFFESTSFMKFLNFLLNATPIAYRGKIRRFRPGLDYTVAHYGILSQESILDVTLCFSGTYNNQNLWESGDVGGYECYIAADNENSEKEADDHYDESDDSELLSLAVKNNTLSLVFRDPGTMRFIKYLGTKAPSSRWDLSFEYKVDFSTQEE